MKGAPGYTPRKSPSLFRAGRRESLASHPAQLAHTPSDLSVTGMVLTGSSYVPQDMASLIANLGGPENFTSRLDLLHEASILDIGDEQAFLPVFQYHYAGRPSLSTKRAHYYVPSRFNTSVAGLPGNDDSGAMGSFAVLAMMGLWPVPGQDVYLISAPFFKEVSLRNSITGSVATIRNKNFDPDYRSIYIQSATRDGKPWSQNWLPHDFFMEGGVLELELGEKESNWGTRIQDLPPSMSHYQQQQQQQQ